LEIGFNFAFLGVKSEFSMLGIGASSRRFSVDDDSDELGSRIKHSLNSMNVLFVDIIYSSHN
jgi:hypothetical protein